MMAWRQATARHESLHLRAEPGLGTAKQRRRELVSGGLRHRLTRSRAVGAARLNLARGGYAVAK